MIIHTFSEFYKIASEAWKNGYKIVVNGKLIRDFDKVVSSKECYSAEGCIVKSIGCTTHYSIVLSEGDVYTTISEMKPTDVVHFGYKIYDFGHVWCEYDCKSLVFSKYKTNIKDLFDRLNILNVIDVDYDNAKKGVMYNLSISTTIHLYSNVRRVTKIEPIWIALRRNHGNKNQLSIAFRDILGSMFSNRDDSLIVDICIKYQLADTEKEYTNDIVRAFFESVGVEYKHDQESGVKNIYALAQHVLSDTERSIHIENEVLTHVSFERNEIIFHTNNNEYSLHEKDNFNYSFCVSKNSKVEFSNNFKYYNAIMTKQKNTVADSRRDFSQMPDSLEKDYTQVLKASLLLKMLLECGAIEAVDSSYHKILKPVTIRLFNFGFPKLNKDCSILGLSHFSDGQWIDTYGDDIANQTTLRIYFDREFSYLTEKPFKCVVCVDGVGVNFYPDDQDFACILSQYDSHICLIGDQYVYEANIESLSKNENVRNMLIHTTCRIFQVLDIYKTRVDEGRRSLSVENFCIADVEGTVLITNNYHAYSNTGFNAKKFANDNNITTLKVTLINDDNVDKSDDSDDNNVNKVSDSQSENTTILKTETRDNMEQVEKPTVTKADNTVKIQSKIVGYKVITNDTETQTDTKTSNVMEKYSPDTMHEGIKRLDVLNGSTYKITPTNAEHALYVTINNHVLNEGTDHEQIVPYEIFLNSKNMEHFQWVLALTRVISAVFRKGGDATFLVEELEGVFDPKGGYWKKGKFIPSLVAEIGSVIKEHLVRLGLIEIEEMPEHVKEILQEKRKQARSVNKDMGDTTLITPSTAEDEASKAYVDSQANDSSFPPNATVCKKCNHKAVVLLDGCSTCLQCGDSKCG